MSDHVCVGCEHGPHRKAPCTTCGCTNWQNAAVVAARAAINTNNLLMQSIPANSSFLSDILEILVELHPEAVARINARREEARLKLEAEAAEQYKTMGSEAANTPTDSIGSGLGETPESGPPSTAE